MAVFNQLSRLPVVGGDIPYKNYSGSDIASGVGVLFDTVNKGDFSNAAGIVVPTAAGGVVGTCGITLERIVAGGTGRVCCLGGAIGVANATLNPGNFVELSDVAAHLGEIIASTSTHEILGRSLSAAVAGDPVLVWVNPVAHN